MAFKTNDFEEEPTIVYCGSLEKRNLKAFLNGLS